MLGRGPSASLAPCLFLLQTGWQERNLLLLVLNGLRRQGHSGRAAALDGWAAARDAGAAMLKMPGMQHHGGTDILHGALVHSLPGFTTATRLLAVQGWPVLLQRPAMDFHGWGADGLHMAHLHPPPGLAEIAALLWRAAAPGWAWLHGLAGLRLALAGPLDVAAEAAGVVARGKVHRAFVAAPCGTVPRPALLTADRAFMAQVLVTVAFTVVHPVAEMAKPLGINSLGKRKKPTNFFFSLFL